ncbi:sugar transferase [Turicibacter sanguinis]|uniref:sugar transferase n=1 Tax=Turicibacter sanguinis TaxID=154288 RepID=UPI0006C47C06|nr:sugar transferase [Turicibacter sanguinis]MDB8576355.1 sugar transferase [Turicibacter sanguinis]MDB8579315.1 sugar transferase [Turicibacter sanguinis]MDB8585046.1 sugar transferase [Turicibacter sanguinis]MDB8588087.1 sugar transferase [Turicibacter sanguinis]MDB8598817.1 sugar transferase [Turicibacter sanguinis]
MYKKFGKRLFDIIGALIILPGFLILFIPVGISIWISDRGNIFYNAKRLGKDGKVFKMYKFRSMKMNAPDLRNEDGSTYNGEDDPRLTKIGKFIRKTSIDELPQVINIIKGDMSFIGPRPDLPEHMEMYEGDESRKLEVLPGLTGYSQAYYRNSIEWKDRIKNDIYYVDHVTPIMDIKIILKTVESVVFRKNVFINKENEVGT